MTARPNNFWPVFLGALVLALFLGAGAAWSVHASGMLEIDLHAAGGTSVTGIRVPAALGRLALACVPLTAFEECAEAARYAPLLEEACRQLGQAPDFVLVEVLSEEEHVRICKRGGQIVVEVDAKDERVHLAVPLSLARAVVRKLERAAERCS